VIKAKTDQVEI